MIHVGMLIFSCTIKELVDTDKRYAANLDGCVNVSILCVCVCVCLYVCGCVCVCVCVSMLVHIYQWGE